MSEAHRLSEIVHFESFNKIEIPGLSMLDFTLQVDVNRIFGTQNVQHVFDAKPSDYGYQSLFQHLSNADLS